MMRALWTAASGMNTQQTHVDTIANNLSNINTAGYKTEKAEFKTCFTKICRASQRIRMERRNRCPHR